MCAEIESGLLLSSSRQLELPWAKSDRWGCRTAFFEFFLKRGLGRVWPDKSCRVNTLDRFECVGRSGLSFLNVFSRRF